MIGWLSRPWLTALDFKEIHDDASLLWHERLDLPERR